MMVKMVKIIVVEIIIKKDVADYIDDLKKFIFKK
jgi:hypothetical protein